jgi:hypothetical protein
MTTKENEKSNIQQAAYERSDSRGLQLKRLSKRKIRYNNETPRVTDTVRNLFLLLLISLLLYSTWNVLGTEIKIRTNQSSNKDRCVHDSFPPFVSVTGCTFTYWFTLAAKSHACVLVAQTLESWVRIPPRAWVVCVSMSFSVTLAYVVKGLGSGRHLVQRVY